MFAGHPIVSRFAARTAMGLVLWLGLPAIALAQPIEVEASVNIDRIGVEDLLQLTVAIHGDAQGRAGNPQLPDMPGFRVAGQSTSTSIQLINGQMSSTRSILYQLQPLAEGRFEIGAIEVSFEGETYRTDPIPVEVVPGSVAPPARPRSLDPFDRFSPFSRRRTPSRETTEEEIFVRAELSRPSVYLGEQVVLTYRLYTQVPVMGLEVDEEPSLTGFWVENVELPRGREPEQTEVDGKRYYRLPIRRQILFPTTVGRLEIDRARFSMAVRITSGDPFDSFFMRASDPVRRDTPPVSLEVKALPEAGRPRDFSGTVGVYSLKAELNKEEVEVGDPVTLTLSIEGQGNLRSTEPPEFPATAGFRAFDPKTDESLRATSRGFGGVKQWEYVLVPETGGQRELGPWSFNFFDPTNGSYQQATAGPLVLRVTGAAATVEAGAPAASSRGEVRLLRRDIRFLKQAPERLGEGEPAFHESWLFYLSLALPLLWNLGLVLHRRQQIKERTHSKLFRSRRAEKMARARLKQAAGYASAGSKDFYEETSAALVRFVADKVGVSASGLTTQASEAHLEERGVPEALRQDYHEVVGRCDEGRFTPGERRSEEMRPLLERARELIVSLERHMG